MGASRRGPTSGNGTQTTDRPRAFTYDGIRIRPMQNPGGSLTWRVEVGERIAGKRRLKQYKTREEAEAFAAVMVRERMNKGVEAFSLDLDQRNLAVKAFARLAEAQLQAGVLLPAIDFYIRHHRPEGGDVTVDKLVDDYLKAKRTGQAAKSGRPLRERSLTDLESRLNIFSRAFGSKLIKDVTAPEIKEWLDDPTRERQTRRNYHTILGGLFRYAAAHKFVGSSPLAEIPKPAKVGDEDKKIGLLTVEEAGGLLVAALENPELELGWYLALGLFCGCRTAELERLTVDDVRRTEGFVHIGPRVAKKRRIRNVDFAVERVEEVATTGADGQPHREARLVKLDPASAWLNRFAAPSNGRICPDGLRYKWMRLLELCGWTQREKSRDKLRAWKFLKPWPANALRHSFASYLYELTGNAPVVCSRLGHADDDLLFEHYRALTRKGSGLRFFSLTPDKLARENIVPMPAATPREPVSPASQAAVARS